LRHFFEVGDLADLGVYAEFCYRLFGDLREGFAFVATRAKDLDLHEFILVSNFGFGI